MEKTKKQFVIYEDISQDGKLIAKRYSGTISFMDNGLFSIAQEDGEIFILNQSKIIKIGDEKKELK